MELSKNYNKVLEGLKAFGYDDLEDLPAKTKELLLYTITVTEVLTLTDVGCSYFTENTESKECKTCEGNGITWHKKSE
tara:strand:- start:345 stop:578 length:234 start_codon:yes stop_codon:yes gene_type:complete